jgi:hypothetical protein
VRLFPWQLAESGVWKLQHGVDRNRRKASLKVLGLLRKPCRDLDDNGLGGQAGIQLGERS